MIFTSECRLCKFSNSCNEFAFSFNSLWPVYCVAGQLLVPESFHHSHHCMLPAPFVFSCPAESIGSPVRQIVS